MLRSVRSRIARLHLALDERTQLIGLNRCNLLLISEGKNWILDDFGNQIACNLNHEVWRPRLLSVLPQDVKGHVMHLIERYRFFRLEDPESLCRSNRVIVTWWHGGANQLEQIHLDSMISQLPKLAHLPLDFHITSSLYRDILHDLGVPMEKIVHVPMGVDRGRFAMRETSSVGYKTQLGVPENKICIGYFQRDGEEEPKLVKGPDVFIRTIEHLWSQRDNLFVLLAGPKRGYVMRELDRIGVPYQYAGWVPATEMASYYFASDLYLITSREEGGPAAVLECMATGTPLISTRVGMAVDVIEQGRNGYLVEIEDHEAIAHHALSLINDAATRADIRNHALETAARYDWKILAPRYAEMLYTTQ